MNTSNIHSLIESLRKRIDTGIDELFRDDLTILTGQAIAEVNAVCPIAGLEKKVQAAETLDLQTLRSIYQILADPSIPDNDYPLPSEKPTTFKGIIEEIKSGLESIEGHEVELGPLEILLRAEMWLDSRFNSALMCLGDNAAVLSKVEGAVREKLESLSDEVVADLWRMVRSEFDTGSWSKGLPLDTEILGRDFMAQDSPKKTRKKIVAFLVRFKPRLWLKAFKEGAQALPIRSPGLARFSLMKSRVYQEPLTRVELLVFNSLLRALALWDLGTHRESFALIAELGASKTGRLIGSNEFQRVKKGLQNGPGGSRNYLSLLLDELDNLVNLTSGYLSRSSPVERALLNYKLSLELFHNEENIRIRKIPSRKKELTLQKELCRYLLHRDILSYGVSFADSEIDLLVKGSSAETFVVEVKVYDANRKPNRNRILKSLTQLLSYMTQNTESRGILLFYNLSEIIIMTPGSWIKGQFAIIVVNLGEKSPSKRDQALVISPSSIPDELITVQRVN